MPLLIPDAQQPSSISKFKNTLRTAHSKAELLEKPEDLLKGKQEEFLRLSGQATTCIRQLPAGQGIILRRGRVVGQVRVSRTDHPGMGVWRG